MPQVKPRPLTKWEQANKASQQAAQALKQQKIEQYSLAKHGTLRRAVHADSGQLTSWRAVN